MSILLDASAPEGFLVTSFAGDDWRTSRAHIRMLTHTGVSWKGPRSESRNARQEGAGARHRSIAEDLWHAAVRVAGSLAEVYLVHRCGELLPEMLDEHVLRFHPTCPFKAESGELLLLPAVLAAMTDIHSGTFCGVHRTALRSDGRGKSDHPGLGVPKKMLGKARGACVKLTRDEEVSCGLHIAEGLETALACVGMGFRPVWAALSAGGIASFPVLNGIEAITVFADNDKAGLNAAFACRERWLAAGREVTIAVPPHAGFDFADGCTP